MMKIFRLKIALRTMRDNWKISLILTLIFVGIAGMYSAAYPAFEGSLEDMSSSFEGEFAFLRGFEYMTTYPGFLTMELYEIFWILILGMLIGFLAASLISKEIEAKTIDLLMSNPVSRKQLVLEKYVGLIPFILLINVATLLTVYGATVAIGEEVNLGYLVMTHTVSVPYFLAIAGVGLLISVLIDEKMKASIITIAIILGMYIFESISLLLPDYEFMGYISLTHYFVPADILIEGNVDVLGVGVLSLVAILCLIAAMLYFDYRNIVVS
jgi:ABC-2 type transport system permease protein